MQVAKLREILKHFCETTAVSSWRFIIKKSKFERIFWIWCCLIGIASVVYITICISQHWAAESVYITLEASSRRITQVDFPGVAICDINKISRQRAIQLANNLTNFTTNKTFQEALTLVRLMGNLYDFNIYGASSFSNIQNILNAYDNVTMENKLLVLRLLSLITPCEDLVRNCSWNSMSYKCMDLFQTRLTDTGFCCVFNYIRSSTESSMLPNKNKEVPKESRKFLGTGISKGLSVTINNNISDYFYTSMATRGSLLKIFLPGDFPDLSSGSLRQIIVQEKSELLVNVDANTLITADLVRALPILQRKCKFADEEETAFGHYTSSNCFVSCKLLSIISLCNCVPFNLPIGKGINEDNLNICDLVDIPCLNRYKGKWTRYFPTEDPDVKELSLDIEDSLYCDECLPNCNDVTYSIDTNYFEFYSEDPLYPNSSRVHIYSNKAYTNLYKKMVTVTWYEALSTFGGIVSILLGISIIHLTEIGVLVLKLLVNYLKKICKN